MYDQSWSQSSPHLRSSIAFSLATALSWPFGYRLQKLHENNLISIGLEKLVVGFYDKLLSEKQDNTDGKEKQNNSWLY